MRLNSSSQQQRALVAQLVSSLDHAKIALLHRSHQFIVVHRWVTLGGDHTRKIQNGRQKEHIVAAEFVDVASPGLSQAMRAQMAVVLDAGPRKRTFDDMPGYVPRQRFEVPTIARFALWEKAVSPASARTETKPTQLALNRPLEFRHHWHPARLPVTALHLARGQPDLRDVFTALEDGAHRDPEHFRNAIARHPLAGDQAPTLRSAPSASSAFS